MAIAPAPAPVSAWPTPDQILQFIGPNADPDDMASLQETTIATITSYLERNLALGSYTETVNGTGTDKLLMRHWPVQSVQSVVMNGTTVIGQAAFQQPGYLLDPDDILRDSRVLHFPGYVLDRGVLNIAISYTAGYNPLPADAVRAFLFTAQAIDSGQAVDQNMSSESSGGVYQGAFWNTGAGSLPPSARDLLRRYKSRF